MPLDIGVDEGQQVYQYSLSGIGSPYLGLSGIICQGNLQFPSTGVELVASKMTIDCIFNGGSGAVSGTSRSFGSVIMDYVTVQAVSQPQTPVLGDINGDGAVDVQRTSCAWPTASERPARSTATMTPAATSTAMTASMRPTC